jgi:hypothetical protein
MTEDWFKRANNLRASLGGDDLEEFTKAGATGDAFSWNSGFFITPNIQDFVLNDKQEEEEKEKFEVHAYQNDLVPIVAPIGIKPTPANHQQKNDWKSLNLNAKSTKKQQSAVLNFDENIEVIECHGQNTILPHGRAQHERRYICQGQPIHRATFWRHRKKGCPHLQ